MKPETIFNTTKTIGYEEFCSTIFFKEGEVDASDIYHSRQGSYYVVREWRWVALLAAHEYPVLVPGIKTCVPTIIRAVGEAYLFHVFAPENLSNLQHLLTATTTMETFIKEGVDHVTDRVQRRQQGEIEQLYPQVEVSNYLLPTYCNVILYQGLLSFFNAKDQLVHQHEVKE